jgi:hypothetical protein
MSPELQESLDHASKLDRSPAHVARLMADGKRQACGFLEQRGFGKPIASQNPQHARGRADPSGPVTAGQAAHGGREDERGGPAQPQRTAGGLQRAKDAVVGRQHDVAVP